MRVTHEHESDALRLLAEPAASADSAAAGYLDAVERIEVEPFTGQVFVNGGLGDEDHPDEPGHAVSILSGASIVLTVGTEYEQGEEVLDPTSARALAYELLVLADIAERQKGDSDAR